MTGTDHESRVAQDLEHFRALFPFDEVSSATQRATEAVKRSKENSAALREGLVVESIGTRWRGVESPPAVRNEASPSRRNSPLRAGSPSSHRVMSPRYSETRLDALETRGHERLAAAVRSRTQRREHRQQHRARSQQSSRIAWNDSAAMMHSVFRKRAVDGQLDCQGFLDWASEVGLNQQLTATHVERIFWNAANKAREGHTTTTSAGSTPGTVSYTEFVAIARQCVEAVEDSARLERVEAYKLKQAQKAFHTAQKAFHTSFIINRTHV